MYFAKTNPIHISLNYLYLFISRYIITAQWFYKHRFKVGGISLFGAENNKTRDEENKYDRIICFERFKPKWAVYWNVAVDLIWFDLITAAISGQQNRKSSYVNNKYVTFNWNRIFRQFIYVYSNSAHCSVKILRSTLFFILAK